MALVNISRVSLRGDYVGSRDANINFKFRFCDQGIYYYTVEQTGVWRLAHRGQFKFGNTRDPRNPTRQLIIARFEPTQFDLLPETNYAYQMLEERALPSNKVEEYLLYIREYSHRVNPAIKLVEYSFQRPDPRGGYNTDWTIRKFT